MKMQDKLHKKLVAHNLDDYAFNTKNFVAKCVAYDLDEF